MWIRNGDGNGRVAYPHRPILVEIMDLDDVGGFHALPITIGLERITFWYTISEIINPNKKRKGNFIGGHQVYQ